MKNKLKTLLFTAAMAVVPMVAMASGGGHYPKAPIDIRDQASLQRGAQIFTNYCLSCHSANNMRFNRLTDIGLTEKQIKDNLIFTDAKIGDTMRGSMKKEDAVAWFGAAPPDLTLIARSRGADYLYAYLKGFYKDPTRATGWNNTVFDKVGMPHVLWEQQGYREVELDKKGMPIFEEEHGVLQPKLHWVQTGLHSNGNVATGEVDSSDYDKYVADLVNFMVYMGEPAQHRRTQIGYVIMLFLLGIMLPLAYFLKKEYWKDVH